LLVERGGEASGSGRERVGEKVNKLMEQNQGQDGRLVYTLQGPIAARIGSEDDQTSTRWNPEDVVKDGQEKRVSSLKQGTSSRDRELVHTKVLRLTTTAAASSRSVSHGAAG
jgi:hypothetical protein